MSTLDDGLELAGRGGEGTVSGLGEVSICTCDSRV
jgi:hypothetical protein